MSNLNMEECLNCIYFLLYNLSILVQIFIIYILIKNLNMTNPALERNHSYKGLGVTG